MSKHARSDIAAKPPAVAESRCQTCKPTASRKYDVYGAIRSGDSGTSAHKFVGALGHPSEDNTGLIYMQARYMDPVTGRFVSEDPAGHGVNWYTYAGSAPTGRVDINGYSDEDITDLWRILGEALEVDPRHWLATGIANNLAPWMEQNVNPILNALIVNNPLFSWAFDDGEKALATDALVAVVSTYRYAEVALKCMGLGSRIVQRADEIEEQETLIE